MEVRYSAVIEAFHPAVRRSCQSGELSSNSYESGDVSGPNTSHPGDACRRSSCNERRLTVEVLVKALHGKIDFFCMVGSGTSRCLVFSSCGSSDGGWAAAECIGGSRWCAAARSCGWRSGCQPWAASCAGNIPGRATDDGWSRRQPHSACHGNASTRAHKHRSVHARSNRLLRGGVAQTRPRGRYAYAVGAVRESFG